MKQGWKIKKLGEVCKFEGGSQPPKTQFSYEKKDNYIRLIQIRDYKSDNHIVYIPKNKAKRFCNENDIMIGRYGPPVFQILKGLNGAYNVALMKAIPNEKVLSKDFVYLFLKHSEIQDYIIHLSQRAAGQTGVNKEAIEDYPILLPPLPEQKRIVAKLDEIFEQIDKAKANAEQNLKNARELFESYLQRVFENKGDGCVEKRIQDIAKVVNGYSFDSKDFSSTNTIKSVKITNVGVREFVEETDNYLPEKYKETLKDYQVKEGNIVIALTRTIIAGGLKIAIVPKRYDGALLNQRVAALIPIEKLINQRYLYNYLTTDCVAKYVMSNVNTLMQPNLSIIDLRNLLVPLPSLKVQQTIVHKLDALSAETKKLEAVYQQKIYDLEELKKSVLQKAFNGEL